MNEARERWNHNVHYHRVLLDALPAVCDRVLDVGCGEGTLARKLVTRVASVVALDVDEPVLQRARAANSCARIDYVYGDLLTCDYEQPSFDAVVSVAMLHHVDQRAALQRMADLVRPGGVVAAIGLARTRRAMDWVYDGVGFWATRALQLRRTRWEPDVPIVWPPPHTYSEVRRIAHATLPGVRFQRHVLFRYSLVWTKPMDA